MPVEIGKLAAQATKLSLKFQPTTEPIMAATQQMLARVAQAATSIQMIGFVPIIVIPAGALVDYGMTIIEILVNMQRAQIARMRKEMMKIYVFFKTLAIKTRKQAEIKLFTDLKKAQNILILEVEAMEKKLKIWKVRLPQVQKDYETQMSLYMKELEVIKTKAKKAKAGGDLVLANMYADSITLLDPWLGDILNILTEKITLTIDIKFLEFDIKIKKPPTLIQLKKDWVLMSWTWSFMFNVAVPYYPDIPDYPNLPPMPPIFRIPSMIRCTAMGVAKWLSTPQLPPLGIIANATLHCALKEIAIMMPPLAAQLEAQNDAILMYMGLCI